MNIVGITACPTGIAHTYMAQEALEEAAAAYEAGEIELKEYTAAVSALQYQRQVVNTIQEYQSKLSYAEQIRETTGQEIWLVSDRGYEEIFGKYSRQREFILILALVTAIMIIVSESIAMEYRTGMYQIVHSAPNGRAAVMRWKITALISGICTTFTVCRIWQHRR